MSTRSTNNLDEKMSMDNSFHVPFRGPNPLKGYACHIFHPHGITEILSYTVRFPNIRFCCLSGYCVPRAANYKWTVLCH